MVQTPLAEEIAALQAKCSNPKTPEHIKAKDAEKLAKAEAELQAVQELLRKMQDLLQSHK
jgi:hypothetical protein